MSDRDGLARDIVSSALSRSASTGRALELHRELVEQTTPPLAGDLWAAGWRKKPSRDDLSALVLERIEHPGFNAFDLTDAILALLDGGLSETGDSK